MSRYGMLLLLHALEYISMMVKDCILHGPPGVATGWYAPAQLKMESTILSLLKFYGYDDFTTRE